MKVPEFIKNYYGVIIGVIVVLFIIMIMIIAGLQTSEYMSKYIFYPGKDSSDNNIGNQASLVNNITGLKGTCDNLRNCRGFNTNAWFKDQIRPQAEWVTWTRDPNKGLYVKVGERFESSPEKYGRPNLDPFDPQF